MQNTSTSAHDYYRPPQPSLPHNNRTARKHDANQLLALALLLDFLPHELAHQLHQRFASEVLYQLPQGRSPLSLSRHDIMGWVNAF
jgi:hypothetical protein